MEIKYTKPVWFRLGAYIRLSPDEISLLNNGELNLQKVIMERGIEINGDSYAIDDDHGVDTSECPHDLDPIQMIAKM